MLSFFNSSTIWSTLEVTFSLLSRSCDFLQSCKDHGWHGGGHGLLSCALYVSPMQSLLCIWRCKAPKDPMAIAEWLEALHLGIACSMGCAKACKQIQASMGCDWKMVLYTMRFCSAWPVQPCRLYVSCSKNNTQFVAMQTSFWACSCSFVDHVVPLVFSSCTGYNML